MRPASFDQSTTGKSRLSGGRFPLSIAAKVSAGSRAREIDLAEAERRLDFYLDLDVQLMREPNPLPMLH